MSALLHVDILDQLSLWALNVVVHATTIAAASLLVAMCFRNTAAMRYWVLCLGLVLVLVSPSISALIQGTGNSWLQIAMPTGSVSPANTANSDSKAWPVDGEQVAKTTHQDGFELPVMEAPPIERVNPSNLAAPVSAAPGQSLTATAPPPKWHQTALRYGASPLILIWLVGVVVHVLRMSTGWLRLLQILRTAKPITDERIQNAFDRACHTVGCHRQRRPQLVTSEAVSGPLAAGIFRSKVVLPEFLAQQCNPQSLADMLVHEVAHVVRRDQMVVLLQNLVSAFYWPHPLVGKLNRELARAREEVCDNFVLAASEAPTYSRTLLSMAQCIQQPEAIPGSVGFFTDRWKLEQRVAGLLDHRRNRTTSIDKRGWLFLAASTVLLAMMACVGTITMAVAEDDSPMTNTRKVRIILPSGNAAPGALVSVAGFELETGKSLIFAETETNSDGYCQVDENALSTSKGSDDIRFLIARHDGYGIGWKRLGGDPLPTQNEQEVFEVKLHEQGVIEGRLVDIEGQPAAGESLQVEMIKDTSIDPPGLDSMVGIRGETNATAPRAWLPPVTTDETGRFQLTGVPSEHGLSMSIVNSKKFAPQDIAINTGQPEQRGERDATYRPLVKNVRPGEELVLALSPAKVFTGTITYEDTGDPVPGAKVTIWASQQQYGSMVSVAGFADDQGRYRILPRSGIRFGVTAYPPSRTAYMARETERISWEDGSLNREVDIALPRVALVRGRILETGTDQPVEGATITFESSDRQTDAPANVVTGWQAKQTSDSDGRFTFAVPRGRGTLLVKKKDSNFILQHLSSGQIQSGKPGGTRVYAHALHEIQTSKTDDAIDVEIRVQPGSQVSGEMVDEQGSPINEAFVVTNLNVWDYSGVWRGYSRPNPGSKFQLQGLQDGVTHPVHFLDAHRKLGATINVQATDENLKVVLKPCGTARAKFILDREDRMFSPSLYVVATPGVHKFDFEAAKAGSVAADSDFVNNIDRINYRNPSLPKDDDGYYTFPALIPGATYRLITKEQGGWEYQDFTVQAGETLDLGVFTPKFDD